MQKTTKECEDFYNKTEDFIEYKLTIEDAYKYIEHCEGCDRCIDELKEQILIRSLLSEELYDDIYKQIEDEIKYRFQEVNKRNYFYEILQRNMKYFVVGATIFIILSYIMDLIF